MLFSTVSFFFFSSRRRHTRLQGDWSSDVCSSDLLAFLLLAELNHLSEPPAVVVQLHAEETGRSGYVRYVTSRYGDLVDAFSLTSRDLADTVMAYGIPEPKCHVIYTGVDAEREFSPRHHRPAAELGDGVANVLFPARLTAQKD